MPNTSSQLASALPPDVWAEVCAHDRVMRYRRLGAGMPILLLFHQFGSAPMADELVRVLTTKFRLIVPELSSRSNPTDWIAEFLEGLGTSAVTLIAAGPLCMPAIEIALRDADQIARIVLLPDGDADESSREPALVATFGVSHIPALIVRPGLGVTETVTIIAEFVGGDVNGAG
jgi:hypothetical protein